MNLSENITWTDILTLVLLFVTVYIFTTSVFREKRKASDILQSKNYYFLSLMLQMRKKKLSASFTEFVKILGEEGQESVYIKLHPVVESRSIKNIAVDDLLEYYSKPVRRQNDIDFEHIQKAWFFCFEYCQQWESSQENAIMEQNDIDGRGKVFYDGFFDKFEEIEQEVSNSVLSGINQQELLDSFRDFLKKTEKILEEKQKFPSMYNISEEYYKPLLIISAVDVFQLYDILWGMISDGRKIYNRYWGFIQEKITHFTRQIEIQRRAEIEFDKSIKILINYSIQHSEEEFKDMYRTLDNHMNGKQ